MDELADTLGIDRLEFRLRNALRVGDTTATGQTLAHSAGLAQCLEALRPHWRKAQDEIAAFNAAGGPKRRGVGIGCMWYGIGNTSMSNPSCMRVGLSPAGTLTLYSGAVDIGQGSNTIMTQIAADALGLPAAQFALVAGDTDLTADAGKTSASRQTFVSGKAAERAGRDLRRQILRLANAGPEAVLSLDGARLTVRDGGEVRVIDLATAGPLMGEGTFDPPTTPLDADGQGIPYATYAFAAQIATVEVDIELGTVKVLRMVAAHDVGKAINPTLVEGQIEGGIAQGLGLALMEEYLPGRTENLHDYLIPDHRRRARDRVHPDRGSRAARARRAPRASASPAWCRRRRPSWAPSITPPACAARRVPVVAASPARGHRGGREGTHERRHHAHRGRGARPASCAAMPARCCAASGRAAPAPATAMPTRTASWCASIRWCCWPSPISRASPSSRAAMPGAASWARARAPSSPASAPPRPIPTTSPRPSSSRRSTTASTWSRS